MGLQTHELEAYAIARAYIKMAHELQGSKWKLGKKIYVVFKKYPQKKYLHMNLSVNPEIGFLISPFL